METRSSHSGNDADSNGARQPLRHGSDAQRNILKEEEKTMDAKEAVHSVEHAASHARGSVIELATQALKMANSFRSMRATDAVDSVLGRVGLQRQSSMLVPIGIFVAGATLGGLVGLALAPSAGKKLRKRVARFLWSEIDAVEEQASKVAERVTDTVHDMIGDEKPKARTRNGAKHA